MYYVYITNIKVEVQSSEDRGLKLHSQKGFPERESETGAYSEIKLGEGKSGHFCFFGGGGGSKKSLRPSLKTEQKFGKK